MTESKYFNVEIKYISEEEASKQPIPFQTPSFLHYQAMTRKEVEKYMKYVKSKEFGNTFIGSKEYRIVRPIWVKVYDFSKTSLTPSSVRADYVEAVEEVNDPDFEWSDLYRRLGREVTDEFGINLEELNEPGKNVSVNSKKVQTVAATDGDGAVFTDGNGEAFTIDVEDNGNDDSELLNANAGEETRSTHSDDRFVKLNHHDFYIKDTVVEPAFNVDIIAEEFARQIKSMKEETGQMIGILGAWGRGKTYFFKKVCEKLNIEYEGLNNAAQKQWWRNIFSKKETETADFELIKFHAWKYQKTPAIWAHLYQVFIESYAFGWWGKKMWRLLRLNSLRIGWWRTWGHAIAAIIAGVIWYFVVTPETKFAWLDELVKWSGGIVALVILVFKVLGFYNLVKKPVYTLFGSLANHPTYEGLLGYQAEIQKELKFLLKTWMKDKSEKRILLFVDDLDRCSEKSMVDLVDALRVMLEEPEIISRLVAVVALDDEKLKCAIRHKYRHSYSSFKKGVLEREYMDKLFIFCLKLPLLSNDQRAEYLDCIVEKDGGVSKAVLSEIPMTPDEEAGMDIMLNEQFEQDMLEQAMYDDPAIQDILDEQIMANLPLQRQVDRAIHQRISDWELDYFKNHLSNVCTVSPRAIRIQYYRYLFARNLLVKLGGRRVYYKVLLDNLFNKQGQYIGDGIEKIEYVVKMVKAY